MNPFVSQFAQPAPVLLRSQFSRQSQFAPPQRGMGVGYQQPGAMDAAMLERLRRQQAFEQQQQQKLLLLRQIFQGQ